MGLKQGEVNLKLTALGESRLIPQWQSWAQSTEGQSLRTERQNKVECRACICQESPHDVYGVYIMGKAPSVHFQVEVFAQHLPEAQPSEVQ